MGWRGQFKAGWKAPVGSWQRAAAPPPQPPCREPPPEWEDVPPLDLPDDLSGDLAESKRVIADLLREIEERDSKLAEVSAAHDRATAELEQRRAYIAEQGRALQERDERLAKFEAATAGLIAELQQMQDQLAAAEAGLAAGMTPAFLRAALRVLHPDKFQGHPPVADVAAFVEARYKELADAVAKIGDRG
jgi:chromosome segregation ATPase